MKLKVSIAMFNFSVKFQAFDFISVYLSILSIFRYGNPSEEDYLPGGQ